MSGARVGLRFVVASLFLATVLPLGLVAAFGVGATWRRQLANIERQNVATVRAISVAIDQEVANSGAALDVLATLDALDSPDLAAFDSLARRLLVKRPDWSAILLADSAGRVLDVTPPDTLHDAAPLARTWAPAVISAKHTIVSPLFELPDIPGHFLTVAVPVVRDGRAVLALGARLRSDAFSAILRRQEKLPEGIVAVIDSANRFMARTGQEEDYVGTSVTSAFVDIMSRTSEAAWQTETREGVPVYSAFSRSPRTGLTVALALPREQVDGPVRRILWQLLAFWIVFIALAGGVALRLGRSVVRAMDQASRSANALARGGAIAIDPSRIVEIDDLARGLQQAAATLETRNRERDDASRLKDEFLMTVSHELRTPLTAIYGWARMLSTGQVRDSQRPRALEAIQRNAAALQQLVNDLLDMSRIVSGRLRLDVEPISLPDLIAGAMDTVRPAAVAKNISVTSSVDAEDLHVLGDPTRLQQVIWNLLSNAVKFTPAGGHIDVRAGRSRDLVSLIVCDTGPGIANDFLPHVFDRFRQGVGGTTRAHGGLGLGLAIVRHIVELHGGTVAVANNTPAEGATFRVELPAHAAPPHAETRANPMEGVLPLAATIADRLDGLGIIVVDDDLNTREMLVAALEHAGADVRAAASAEDALMVLQTWQPRVLVSDIEMAGQDGYELLQRVRTDGSRQGLVAIALTAHARPEERLRALDAGFQWHLAKPIDPGELIVVIAALSAQAGEINSPA